MIDWSHQVVNECQKHAGKVGAEPTMWNAFRYNDTAAIQKAGDLRGKVGEMVCVAPLEIVGNIAFVPACLASKCMISVWH